MTRVTLFLILLLAVSCASSISLEEFEFPHQYYPMPLYHRIAGENRLSLDELEIGMSNDQVQEIMGQFSRTFRGKDHGPGAVDNEALLVNKLVRTGSFVRDTLTIDVLWYLTDIIAGKMTDADYGLSPVVLFNDKVVSWEYTDWIDTAKNYEIRWK